MINRTPDLYRFRGEFYSILFAVLNYGTFYNEPAELIFEITSLYPGITQ
jgi:hypothetical protein